MILRLTRSLLVTGMLFAATTTWSASPTVSGPLDVETVQILGAATGDNFGVSVAGGDFNGDGYDDLVVGAPYNDTTADAAGAAFLYFGGSFFDATPDVIFLGEAADDHAGFSVAAGFDMNGDGFEDVAVGVRFSDRGAGNGGAVFVYFGSATPPNSPLPDLYLVGEAADDWFGQSVASAGDVNRDGYDDLIIGAPYNDAVANAAGRAYVVFGAGTTNDVVAVPIGGAAEANAHFGWSVSGAGDVNADGYDDVVVGARLHGTGANAASGRAYIFFGGNPFDSTADIIIEGESKGDWFGESVAGLGDINGDGYDDIIVGAKYRDPGGVSAAGEASVLLGGDPMDTTRDLRYAGPHADANAGKAVGGAGDINGDGFNDMLVGIPFADTSAGDAAGQAVLLLGGGVLDASADVTLSGAQAHGQLGTAVGAAGIPVSGYGACFAVGTHYDAEAGSGAGRVTLLRSAFVLRWSSIVSVDGGLELGFQSRSNRTYQAEKNTNLTGGSWQNLGSPASGDGTMETIIDGNPGVQGFYRLREY